VYPDDDVSGGFMTKFALALLVVVVAAAGSASAQHNGHAPYAGLEQRSIKALSAQQIADLQAGRGMSLALAAELNGYPGPLHTLELADRLGLSELQRARIQALYESMKAETAALGEKLITQERGLDEAFVARKIDERSLQSMTAQIGETQAILRAAHLRYHLITEQLLSPHQRQIYAAARGYR
jgi:hypothetical protein